MAGKPMVWLRYKSRMKLELADSCSGLLLPQVLWTNPLLILKCLYFQRDGLRFTSHVTVHVCAESLMEKKKPKYKMSKTEASLGIQWLRICLPLQETVPWSS